MNITPMQSSRLSHGHTELIHTIRHCGLTSGLQLCLDAGDALSYTSGQSWLDRSGNGYDFFVGATSSSEGSDPTFNGTAGRRSSGEYWSFDGGDYFKYNSANETWMENIHKNNAKFTMACWLYIGSTATQSGFAGDYQTGPIGFIWQHTNTGGIQFLVVNTAFVMQVNGSTATAGVWQFHAVSVDEAVGANGGFLLLNLTKVSFTSTYASPSSSAATATFEIGSVGGAREPLTNTSRMGMFAAWTEALTETQLTAFYMATRGRFGV